MRTTVNLDEDVAIAVERLRRERGLGLSEALNGLARAGLLAPRPARAWRMPTGDLEMRAGFDVANVAEVLAHLEDADAG